MGISPFDDGGGVHTEAGDLTDGTTGDGSFGDSGAVSFCGNGGLQAGSPWPTSQRCSTNIGRSPVASAQTAAQKWVFGASSLIVSSPVIAEDHTIYVATDDGNLHAVDPDGTSKWTCDTPVHVWSSPVIGADGTVYVGSTSGTLYAVTPEGEKRWEYVFGALIRAGPVIGPDGTIYLGVDILLSENEYAHRLLAMDPDGAQKREVEFPERGPFEPSVGKDGTIYVGSSTDDYGIG